MRVFAALPLPGPIILRLEEAARRLAAGCPGLKIVRPEGMHLTLHFFGEIAEEQAARVGAVMEDPALDLPAIPAALGPFGQFPPRGNPRVIWCGIRRGAEAVADRQRTFRRLIGGAGFPPDPAERPFSPHITLARSGSERIAPGALEELPILSDEFVLDRLVLYQSILSRQGAEYRPLKTVAFRRGTP